MEEPTQPDNEFSQHAKVFRWHSAIWKDTFISSVFFLLFIRRTTDKALYYTPSHLPCSAQCRTCDRSGLSTYINGTGGNTEGELNDSQGVALHMLHGGKHVADRVLYSFIRLKSLCLRHCFSVNQTFPSLEFVQ